MRTTIPKQICVQTKNSQVLVKIRVFEDTNNFIRSKTYLVRVHNQIQWHREFTSGKRMFPGMRWVSVDQYKIM